MAQPLKNQEIWFFIYNCQV